MMARLGTGPVSVDAGQRGGEVALDLLNRSNPPLASVTMCFNEPDFLPDLAAVPLDHGSTDRSTSGLAGINVVRLDPSPLDEVWRAGLV